MYYFARFGLHPASRAGHQCPAARPLAASRVLSVALGNAAMGVNGFEVWVDIHICTALACPNTPSDPPQ